ncbi:MAG: hypothetical protein GKR95_23145 [Gammaproteobacteria bacterium]|nr:hypothetical protein [Gammaproteobacteria bacterium]
MTNLSQVINFEQYPIDSLDSPDGLEFLRQIKEELEKQGSCVLSRFVTDEALETLAAEANQVAHLGYQGPTMATPYFFNYNIGKGLDVDENHPVNRQGKRNLRQVATDLISPDHLLSKLYRSEMMIYFISKVLGQEAYCNKDRYQSLNISVMDEGGCQQWHFDSSPMVTTLLLQEPDTGGVFEYAPGIRSDEDENFDVVRDVLDGQRENVKQLSLKRGNLSLFRGHYSLHRVTEVAGPSQRLQAILGYATDPNYEGSADSSVLHYGPRIATLESSML